MNYACPIRWSAKQTDVHKLHLWHSKYLCINTNAPWYFCNMQTSRGFGNSILCQPRQSIDWVLWLEISPCGKPVTSATWKALVPNKSWPKSLKSNRWRLMHIRPFEAASKNVSNYTQWLVYHYLATLPEISVLFLSRKGNAALWLRKGYGPPAPFMEALSQNAPPPHRVTENFS
jgi:hypothetical protein